MAASDLYSIGRMIYEAYFPNQQEDLIYDPYSSSLVVPPHSDSPHLSHLLKTLLSIDPSSRASSSDLLFHPFFTLFDHFSSSNHLLEKFTGNFAITSLKSHLQSMRKNGFKLKWKLTLHRANLLDDLLYIFSDPKLTKVKLQSKMEIKCSDFPSSIGQKENNNQNNNQNNNYNDYLISGDHLLQSSNENSANFYADFFARLCQEEKSLFEPITNPSSISSSSSSSSLLNNDNNDNDNDNENDNNKNNKREYTKKYGRKYTVVKNKGGRGGGEEEEGGGGVGGGRAGKFHAIGRILLKAILDGETIGETISFSLIKMMLDRDVGLSDLEEFDQDLADHLLYLSSTPSVDQLNLFWDIPSFDHILITDENKFDFIQRKCFYHLFEERKSAIKLIKKGFKMIDLSPYISQLSDLQLRQLFYGENYIDQSMIVNLLYFDEKWIGSSTPLLLKKFLYRNSKEILQKFLHFCTGAFTVSSSVVSADANYRLLCQSNDPNFDHNRIIVHFVDFDQNKNNNGADVKLPSSFPHLRYFQLPNYNHFSLLSSCLLSVLSPSSHSSQMM